MFNKQTLKCPVCNDKLGTRIKTMQAAIECDKCMVMWLWHENVDLPMPVITKEVATCGCGRCGR